MVPLYTVQVPSHQCPWTGPCRCSFYRVDPNTTVSTPTFVTYYFEPPAAALIDMWRVHRDFLRSLLQPLRALPVREKHAPPPGEPPADRRAAWLAQRRARR